MAKRAKSQPTPSNVDPSAIVRCEAEYEELMGRVQRLKQQISTMFQRYAEQGVKQPRIKEAYRRRLMDPEEVRAELADDWLYARVLRQITWEAGQGDFSAALVTEINVDDAATARLAAARAYNDGYNTALAGGDEESPYAEGTEQAVRWREGWRDGREDRLARDPDAERETSPAPRRRAA